MSRGEGVKYYPLFMDLAGRACLVVGAGTVAARKARSLLECGARVTVVGERPAPAFRALERRGVVLERRRFRAVDVARQALVIAATDDRTVNAAVSAAARRRGIPVNAVDDPPNCTFIVPAVVRRGDLVVAISTGGKSPAAARLVKEHVAAMLGEEHAALVRLLGAHRDEMKGTVAGQGRRARAWKRMLDEGVLDLLRRGDKITAAAAVRRCIADTLPPYSRTIDVNGRGVTAAKPRHPRQSEAAAAVVGPRGAAPPMEAPALSGGGQETCRALRRGGAKRGTPAGRTEGSTAGVRSDRTPKPARARRRS